MGATVNGGCLGRWFEELCRIRHHRLAEVSVERRNRLVSAGGNCIPTSGGVYAFWWTGNRDLLRSGACNRDIVLVGPGGRQVALCLDDQWLGLGTSLPVPLYVGRNASNLRKRVGQHLMLSTKRILPLGRRVEKAKPPTTSCQLRAGIDHLFPQERDTRSLVVENVGLSYVLLHEADNAANRFYLEDLAIGLMRPALNVDIER